MVVVVVVFFMHTKTLNIEQFVEKIYKIHRQQQIQYNPAQPDRIRTS